MTTTPTSGAADLPEALIGAIMAAAYDFRDAHISGSKNLKRTAHAELESTVRNTLHAFAVGQALSAAPAGPWSLGEMTGNWRDIDLPDHIGVMRVVWRMEEDDGKANPQLEAQAHAVVAALNAASSTPPADQQAAPKAVPGDVLDEALRERDDAEDFIDALLDEVLGHERPEWSSSYGRADALNDVQERMTSLHKPAVDKAWGQFQSAMADSVQEDAALEKQEGEA